MSLLGSDSTITWPTEPPAPRRIDPPGVLRIPLTTRPGAEVPATLPAGTVVSMGQLLTRSLPEADPAALAPLPGKLGTITTITLLNDKFAPAIELIPDPSATQSLPSASPVATPEGGWKPSDLPAWIDRIRSAGIRADRYTCPDLPGQLLQAMRRPIDAVVCTLLDDDPMLRPSAILANRHRDDLAAGVAILGKLVEVRRPSVVIDAGAPGPWHTATRRICKKSRLRVTYLRNDYPTGDPTLLIYSLLGRRLRPNRLPTEVGVLLLDAAAAIAIGRLVREGLPTLEAALAIHDHARQQSHYVTVPSGTPVRHVMEQLELPLDGLRLRAGALLRDVQVPIDAVIGGAEITLHATWNEPPINPDPCIRCGWCLEACPSRISPAGLLEASQQANADLADRFGLDACIECGLCTYICPSRLPLLDGIRTLKQR